MYFGGGPLHATNQLLMTFFKKIKEICKAAATQIQTTGACSPDVFSRAQETQLAAVCLAGADSGGRGRPAQIAGIMAALVAARGEDEARGGGAADPRRWTALRNTVEARAMLKTVFRAAAAHAAQVGPVAEGEQTLPSEPEAGAGQAGPALCQGPLPCFVNPGSLS